LRTDEQHGDGLPTTATWRILRVVGAEMVLADFFMDVLRLSSIGSRAVFLSRYYLATGASNLPAAAAACTLGRRICRRLADPRPF